MITEFPITTLSSGQFFNAANFGPDGGLWIGRYPNPAGIARFDVTTHVYTTISNSLSGLPGVIVAGPDLNIWSSDSGAAPGFARVGTGVCDDSLEGCNLQRRRICRTSFSSVPTCRTTTCCGRNSRTHG